MASLSLSEILGTAIVDSEFRGQLLRDPQRVLHRFALTPEEQELLIGIQARTIEEFAEQLLTRWASNGKVQGDDSQAVYPFLDDPVLPHPPNRWLNRL